MSNESVMTREMMLASFYAASRVGRQEKPWMALNGASAAGLLLHIYGGPKAARDACARMPADPVWGLAAHYLTALVENEAPDTTPPLAAGGERR